MKQNRFIPYGYTIKNGETIIQKEEADIVKQIFKLYINGYSLGDIATELTNKSVPYTAKSTEWNKSRISRIIANSKYLGIKEYDGIIDKSTFDIAAETKLTRDKNKTQRNPSINKIINKVICPYCSYPMIYKKSRSKKNTVNWSCSNPNCPFKTQISDHQLTENILILINRIINNNQLLQPEGKSSNLNESKIRLIDENINRQLSSDNIDDSYVIEQIQELATELYKGTNINQLLNAKAIIEKAKHMKVQNVLDINYFSELVSHLTIDEKGKVTIYTNTGTKLS